MDSKEQNIIHKLKKYATHNIHEIAKKNNIFNEIDDISQTFVNKNDNKDIISEKEASKLTQYLYWDPEINGIPDTIGEPLDKETYQKIRKLARVIIELAIAIDNDDKKAHSELLEISLYLHPLLSRDYRTVELGFELQEYTDFFVDLDKKGREKFGKELLDEWKDSKYID